QIFRVERFKADQQPLTAAGFDQAQKLFIVCGVDAGLADPADFERNQRAEKLLGLIHIRRDVVVHEKDQGLFDLPDLFNDFRNGAARLRAVEIRLNRAELAAKMAAASRLDQADRQVTFARVDRTIGPQAAQRRAARLPVDAPQTSRLKIFE